MSLMRLKRRWESSSSSCSDQALSPSPAPSLVISGEDTPPNGREAASPNAHAWGNAPLTPPSSVYDDSEDPDCADQDFQGHRIKVS